MAVSNYIQSVVDAAKGIPRSVDWFKSKIAEFGKPGALDLIRDGKRANRPFYGRLNMFFYDPKTKQTLPYYDKFPVIFVIDKAEGGFYGLNLHYLPPILRMKMLDGLLQYKSNSKYDETTRIIMSYAQLKRTSKLSYYKPAFKHYLAAHVKSQFAEVTAPEWEIAAFLPTAQWAKGSASKVYSDSRRMLR